MGEVLYIIACAASGNQCDVDVEAFQCRDESVVGFV